MSATEWDSISITAHYTAQVWAQEHLPWAWRFDTRKGRAFYAAVEPLMALASQAGLTTPHDFLVQRHRIIDALVARWRPAQLLDLAGGLSPRCLAYSHKYGGLCTDVDLERMIALKAKLVGGDAPGSYRQAALDLVASQNYVADLGPALARVGPTVVITEGILPYFSLEQQRHVFSRVAALLRWCGGGAYLTDVHHQQEADRLGGITAVFRWGLSRVARSPQHPMIPDEAAGRGWLSQAGFDEVAVHDPATWQRELDLPLRRHGVGLRIYEARVG